MAKDFKDSVEDSVRTFYKILKREPRFYHEEGSGDGEELSELVALVFDDGSTVELERQGRGPYDYTVMARPKYAADKTSEQIGKIVNRLGKKPVSVRYRERAYGENANPHQIMIEFPYEAVEAVIHEKPIIEMPYTLIGGFVLLQRDEGD